MNSFPYSFENPPQLEESIARPRPLFSELGTDRFRRRVGPDQVVPVLWPEAEARLRLAGDTRGRSYEAVVFAVLTACSVVGIVLAIVAAFGG